MKVFKIVPGVILSVGVAFLACWLESLLPIHLIGSAVIAMFIGMSLNYFLKDDPFMLQVADLNCMRSVEKHNCKTRQRIRMEVKK